MWPSLRQSSLYALSCDAFINVVNQPRWLCVSTPADSTNKTGTGSSLKNAPLAPPTNVIYATATLLTLAALQQPSDNIVLPPPPARPNNRMHIDALSDRPEGGGIMLGHQYTCSDSSLCCSGAKIAAVILEIPLSGAWSLSYTDSGQLICHVTIVLPPDAAPQNTPLAQ